MHLAEFINARIAASALPSFAGTSITRIQFRKELNQIFRPLKVRFRLRMDETKYSGEEVLPTSGYFDDKNRKIPVTCFLHFHPKRKTLKLSKRMLDIFIFRAIQVAQHELVHWEQYKHRKQRKTDCSVTIQTDHLSKKKKEDVAYYTESGEIESYAHDIAMEICFFYPDTPPHEVFKTIDRRKKLGTYQRYKKVFRGLEWGEVRKALLQKILEWLPTIQLPERIGA